jgi:hypothetical protein
MDAGDGFGVADFFGEAVVEDREVVEKWRRPAGRRRRVVEVEHGFGPGAEHHALVLRG